MPRLNRGTLTDPITPATLKIVLDPIRLLQQNGKIDKDNFYLESTTASGVELHTGSLIRDITDLVDSAKIFEGRSIFTAADEQIGTNDHSVYPFFRHIASGKSEQDLFTVHSQVAVKLYQEESTVRDIEYKMSYSREDIKNTFRTAKELKRKIHDLKQQINHAKAYGTKSQNRRKERLRDEKRRLQSELANMRQYEFVELSQSIEVELPDGYAFDTWEIFGDLDWGWKNNVEEGSIERPVGVLYVEVDSSRDDFVAFKFSILFDNDVKLSDEDYVLCAGKLQYRVKRYA